jgi:predicted HTH transcriptional regulator
MTAEELRELIDLLRKVEGDLLHLEAKRATHELPRRLWETVSAFANTPDGGVIILGLDEMVDFEVVGVADPKKLQDDLASLCSSMEPPVRAVIEPHIVDGKTLVVAEIPELVIEQKPCYYPPAGLTNGAFIRVADGDHKLTSYEVQMLLISRDQPREDERPVPEASPEDLDPALVAGLLERMGGYELTPSQRMGVGLARHGDHLTNDLYRRFTDVDSRVATRELGDLVRRGILEQVGTRRWTTYRVIPEPTEHEQEPVSPPRAASIPGSAHTGRTRADRRPAILALLAEHGELSRAEIASLLDLNDGNTRKWLRILIDEGAIEATSPPRSKRQSYRLAAG